VEKPSTSLLAGASNSKRIADLQNQLDTIRKQLDRLNSLAESTPVIQLITVSYNVSKF